MLHFTSRSALVLLFLSSLAVGAAGCGSSDDTKRATPTPTIGATALPSATRQPTGTATTHASATAQATSTSPPPTLTATAPPSPTPSATAPPTQTPRLPTSAEVLAAGRYAAGVTTLTLIDTSRPTMPNGTYAGTAARTLVTEVWYPAAPDPNATGPELREAPLAVGSAPYPLIIYSHGYVENRLGGAYLARHLASHGYIVAAPDFPLSNGGAPGGPTINDLPEQPLDISFIIDQLLLPDSRFVADIDAQHIGFTGLSLGGWTTFLAAYHPTLRDPRVRAAAPIAGPSCYFSHAYFGDVPVPLLIVHGDLDALVPYTANARVAYGNANRPKRLVTVHNGSHTGFSGLGAQLPGDNPDDIGCTFLLDALEKSPPDQERLIERLGGSEAGIDTSPCVDPCTATRPLPASVPNARQLELAILSVYPFFEATLRNSASMERFLDRRSGGREPRGQS